MAGVDDLVVLAAGDQDGLGIGRTGFTRLVVEDGVVALEAVGPDIERVNQLLRQQTWVFLVGSFEVNDPA
jgi:hypothetical protein